MKTPCRPTGWRMALPAGVSSINRSYSFTSSIQRGSPCSNTSQTMAARDPGSSSRGYRGTSSNTSAPVSVMALNSSASAASFRRWTPLIGAPMMFSAASVAIRAISTLVSAYISACVRSRRRSSFRSRSARSVRSRTTPTVARNSSSNGSSEMCASHGMRSPSAVCTSNSTVPRSSPEERSDRMSCSAASMSSRSMTTETCSPSRSSASCPVIPMSASLTNVKCPSLSSVYTGSPEASTIPSYRSSSRSRSVRSVTSR